MRTSRIAILRLLICAWAAALAYVTPAKAIAPAQFSLSEIYPAADAVVIVRCGATREVQPKTDDSFNHKTSMTVVKRLHGPSTFPREFELATCDRASCDVDINFLADSKALVFLKWSPDDDAYRSVGRSEGSFPLNDSLEAAMNVRVPELGKILDMPKGQVRDAALTELYVQLCLNPTTREIGVHSLYLDTRSWLPLSAAAVTTAQYRRMSDVVVSEVPPRESTSALAWLLEGFADSKLDAYLIESVRKWDRPGWSTLTPTAIRLLPKRLKVSNPLALAKDLEEHYSATMWGVDIPKMPTEKSFERMRPALISRVLEVLDPKK